MIPANDAAKPWRLQARLKVRAGIFSDMLSYVHPRLRVSEHHGTVDHRFQVVEVRQFSRVDPVFEKPIAAVANEVPTVIKDKYNGEPLKMQLAEVQPEDETAPKPEMSQDFKDLPAA